MAAYWKTVHDYYLFWRNCFSIGWDAGGWIWTALWIGDVLVSSVIIIWRGVVLKDWSLSRLWQAWQIKLGVISSCVFALLFFATAFLVAPFVQYEQKPAVTNEAPSSVEFTSLSNQWKEAVALYGKEQSRADEAEQAGKTKDARLELVLASCTAASTVVVNVVDTEIAEKEASLAQLTSTNADVLDEKAELQYQIEDDRALKSRIENEQKKRKFVIPIYPVWVDAMVTLQAVFAPYIRQCDGNRRAAMVPTIDAICAGEQMHEDIKFGTNCAWKCYCQLEGDPPTLLLALQGQGMLPRALEIGCSGNDCESLWMSLKRGDSEVDSTNCSLSSITNCTEVEETFLNRLTHHLKKELDALR